MKLDYTLRGIDCPNCAAKIEAAVNKLSAVQSAALDYAQLTLQVHVKDSADIGAMEKEMARIFETTEVGSGFSRVEISERNPKRVMQMPAGGYIHNMQILRDARLLVEEADPENSTFYLLCETDWRETLSRAEAALPGIEPASLQEAASEPERDHTKERERAKTVALLLGALLFAAGLALRWALPDSIIGTAVFGAAYLLAAGPVLLATAKSIARLDPFDENFLMSIATLGAFAIGEAPEGVAVVLLYRLGEWMQERATNRSRESIRTMMELKPDHANLLLGARATRVDPASVYAGDAIEVRPGERVPLDGIILEGATSLDVKDMTGESAPRDVAPGDEVIAGAINGGGLITVQVTRPAEDSSVSRILKMMRNSAANKAKTERFFTRFAKIYTPTVVAIAALLMLIPPLAMGGDWREWIYRGLSFLVVSCPCALVLSIPLSYFGGIGAASRRGVLVKGGEALEELARVDTAVFDKTGTLTEGVMQVRSVATTANFTPDAVLKAAAIAESRLDHPIAKAIVSAAGELPDVQIDQYENIPGEGVRCVVNGIQTAVGNARLMARVGHQVDPMQSTCAYVAIGGRYAGCVLIGDRVREGVSAALSGMKLAGIRRTAMLTGDNKAAAAQVAAEIGIDQVRAELLPDQKVEALRGIEGRRMFIGDGVNDAPVLAAAELGVAMGGIGSDAAIEAADVVLMSDDLSHVADAIGVARATRANVAQNVTLALGVKLIVMALVALGLGKMWMAVLADAGVALVCVFNALRLCYTKKQ